MKVKATYQHTFEAVREVEVDEEDFTAWADRRYGEGCDRDLALSVWIHQQDTEWHAEQFPDWRSGKPLPSYFEYQGWDVIDAEPVPVHTVGSD